MSVTCLFRGVRAHAHTAPLSLLCCPPTWSLLQSVFLSMAALPESFGRAQPSFTLCLASVSSARMHRRLVALGKCPRPVGRCYGGEKEDEVTYDMARMVQAFHHDAVVVQPSLP